MVYRNDVDRKVCESLKRIRKGWAYGANHASSWQSPGSECLKAAGNGADIAFYRHYEYDDFHNYTDVWFVVSVNNEEVYNGGSEELDILFKRISAPMKAHEERIKLLEERERNAKAQLEEQQRRKEESKRVDSILGKLR